MSEQDNYGFFGPNYSYADNIPLPGDIGVRQEASFGALIDSVGGMNYYIDTIAFGSRTFLDNHEPQPLGVRYFLNTGQRCSNGATMSQYFNGVTKGDLLGTRVAQGLASSGLPGLRGLAPGMMENARDALDPRPIIAAVAGAGYPVCQQVYCPVGDINGGLADPTDSTIAYVVDPVDSYEGIPVQTRWVQAYDENGNAITLTKDEYGSTPKCYNADGTYALDPPPGCPATEPSPVPHGIAPGQSWGIFGSGEYQGGKVSPQNMMNFGTCALRQPPTKPPDAFADYRVATENTLVSVGALALLSIGLWAVYRR